MQLRTKMLLVLLLLSIACGVSSCASSRIILHPIETVDIIFLTEGETFIAPKDGAFMSSKYINSVLDAKIERK